jgi:predicted phage terminase large subunit-like protein
MTDAETLSALLTYQAEDSLAEFIRIGWPNIDPADFIANWHIDAISEHLEGVTNGDIRRLIINIPPRHMKSLSCSVAWPAWTWAQERRSALSGPSVGFLATSYAQSLSIRDNVKCRRLVESAWYQRRWGSRFQLTGDQNTKIRFENDQGGYRLASSVDGTATGDGGDIIIIDDPISARDALSPTVRQGANEWFDNTMSTRLNNPKTGAYVVIMQRLHEEDLVGHLLDRGDDWTHLCLPARYEHDHPAVWARDPRKESGVELLWPTRMGESEVKKIETALGSYGAAGQLQQRPAPREGGMFKRAWFSVVDAAPAGLTTTVRDWDLAGTVAKPGSDPDWTVGLKMGRDTSGFHYILDIKRFRGSPHEVEQTLLTTAQQDGANTTVSLKQDPGQAGKAQVQALTRMLAGFIVKQSSETGSKETRAAPFAAQCEAGNVRLVRGDWNNAFLDEIEVFPFGRHDDQADAAASAFNVLAANSGPAAWLAALEEADRQLAEGRNS